MSKRSKDKGEEIPTPAFDRKNFEGAVLLKKYVPDIDGNSYVGYYGRVSILSDKEMLGFEVSGQESNWIARIDGPSGTSVNFPGCQVLGVMVGIGEAVNSNNFKKVP